MGCTVGGIYAPERRSGRTRIGFDICDINSGECWRLARVDCRSPVRVGRYGVCIDEASAAADRLLEIAKISDIVIIDEIGPMELLVPRLRRAIESLIMSSKPIVAVVHRRLRQTHPALYSSIERLGPVIRLTRETRDAIRSEALAKARVLALEACGDKRRKSTAKATGP